MNGRQSSDPPKCGFCHRGATVVDVCGHLHSEMTKEKVLVAAHHKCMQYSAMLVQYRFEHFGGFKIAKVQDEMVRAKLLKCFICKCKNKRKGKVPKGGASAGCALKKCNRSFHYYCARTDPDTVTKRLVVAFKKKNKKTILYRVFCCADHQTEYRSNLKSLIDSGRSAGTDIAADNNENTSDMDADDDDEDEDGGGDGVGSSLLMSQDVENTSLISFSDSEISPIKKNVGRKKDTTVASSKRPRSTRSVPTRTVNSSHVNKDAETNSEDEFVPNSKLKNKMASREVSPSILSPQSSTKVDLFSNSKTLSLSKVSHSSASGKRLSLKHGSSPSSKTSSTNSKSRQDKMSQSPCDSDTSDGSRKSLPSAEKKRKTNQQVASSKRKLFDSDSSDADGQVTQPSVVNGRARIRRISTDDDETCGSNDNGDETGSTDDNRTSNDDLENEGMKGSSHFSIKRGCVLCVPAISKLSPQIRSGIAREICKADGSDVNIMMWHELHPTVSQNNKDLVFLIMDLAKCLESNKDDELKNFLLNTEFFKKKVDCEYKINSKMLDDLEDPDMVKQILEKTWKKATQVLRNIFSKTGSCVGSILSVESCKVLKIYIGDTLDQDGSIRSVWPDPEMLIQWDDNTRLCLETNSTTDASKSHHSVECEERQIENWLSSDVSPLSSVAIYPPEKILKSSEQSSNCVERLREKIDPDCTVVGSSVLVFERVDTQVVNFDNYFRKVLKSLDSARLSNLVILLSASLLKSDADRSAVVSLLPGDMQSDVKVFTAFDPASMLCSWVIIQISVSSNTKVKKKTYHVVNDGQIPSVSRESSKRLRSLKQSSTKSLKKSKK